MTDFAVDELPAASALGGTEQLYGFQSSNDVYITPNQLADFILGNAATAELIRDTIGACLVAGSGITITPDDSPNTITISATGSSAFNGITGGTNTTAAMIVGTGASLSATGSGTIHATSSDILHTARTIGGVSFNGSANITVATATGGFTVSGGDLALGANNLTLTGSIGATGARVTKGWFTDLQCTNAIAADITGNAATATTATTASAVAASGITGTTLASGVTASSLTSVGTLTALAVAGTITGTSTSASALAVGANGATNPVLKINANTASAATGIEIIGAAAGGGVQLNAISSGTDEAFTISSKGNAAMIINNGNAAAQVLIRTGGTSRYLTSSASTTYANVPIHSFTTLTSSTASSVRFSVTSAACTNLTASTEAPFVYFNLDTTRQHAAGALTLQRDFRLKGTDHSFASSSTLTDHAVFSVEWSTGASTNATITTTHAIYIPAVTLTGTKTNAYGITVNAPSGATNNYAAQFIGLVGIGRTAPTAYGDFAASTTANASIRVRSGTAPTSPNEGDMWYDGTNLKFRDSTTSRTITWT